MIFFLSYTDYRVTAIRLYMACVMFIVIRIFLTNKLNKCSNFVSAVKRVEYENEDQQS